MKAIILAAGKGLRMKPLTENTPKPLIELNGKSFIERQLTELNKAGITECIIVVGYLKEKIIKKFGKKFNKMKIEFAEQKEQKGTAHGLNCAKDFIKKDFIQVNADLVFEAELIEELMKKKENVLVLREAENAEGKGLVEVQGKKVKKIIEKPSEEQEKEIRKKKPETINEKTGKEPEKEFKENFVNCGIYKFTPEIFPAIEKISLSSRNELELTDAINLLAEQGKVEWIEVKGKFFDIGTEKELR
ncbi:MAG: sugar phosphate nucleotidyltransferase, partial [archaeon]